jgi:hypothetical protein
LEAHDLAASKLVAGREKDRIFVATLLIEKLVDSETLLQRVKVLPIEGERRESIVRWIRATVEDLA